MYKTRPLDKPYEVWKDSPVLPNWEWHVLKKWQKDDDKPNARWFCLVKSPYMPMGELGDVYVKDIITDAQAIKFEMCLGCGAELKKPQVHNALSRYDHGYICSDCGVQEALLGDFIKNKH